MCEILNPVVEEGLAEKLTSEPSPARGKGHIPGGRAGAGDHGLVCSGNRKEASVAAMK